MEGEDEVWVSNIPMASQYGGWVGLKTKYRPLSWEEASGELSFVPDFHCEILDRYVRAATLDPDEFPEASMVYKEKRFPKRRKFFHLVGHFAFIEPLSDVIGQFNLGKGGLVHHPVYYPDLVTPYPVKVYLLNFGGPKDTFLKEYSAPDMFKPQLPRLNGSPIRERWRRCPEEGEIAVSEKALEGVDIWKEDRMYSQIFMRGNVARALQKSKAGVNWALSRCKVVKFN